MKGEVYLAVFCILLFAGLLSVALMVNVALVILARLVGVL